MMRSKRPLLAERPTVGQLETELAREKYRRRYGRVMRSTIYTLITVAAVAVLVATLWLPVLQIYGFSMTPTLDEGEIVVSLKGSDFRQGDIVAFYYNNKILVKRVIAGPGRWVDIGEDGTVTFVVTNTLTEEITDEPTPEGPLPEVPEENIPGEPVPQGPALPQTGVLWWPVPLLACAGMALFLAGWARRRSEECDEA